jgi:hypothetical protein
MTEINLDNLKNYKQEHLFDLMMTITQHQDLSYRKDAILMMMRIQKRQFSEMEIPLNIDRDRTTLCDFDTMTIVGSGKCPKCNGYMGRAPEWIED